MTETMNARALDASTQTAKKVRQCGRQGDLVIWRVRQTRSTAADAPTPAWGIQILAGQHGEHRIIAPAYRASGQTIHLPKGGLVVHTDVPERRHATLALPPGAWEWARQQELSPTGIVRQVQD